MLLLYFRSNLEPKIHFFFSMNFEKSDLFLFLLKEGKQTKYLKGIPSRFVTSESNFYDILFSCTNVCPQIPLLFSLKKPHVFSIFISSFITFFRKNHCSRQVFKNNILECWSGFGVAKKLTSSYDRSSPNSGFPFHNHL